MEQVPLTNVRPSATDYCAQLSCHDPQTGALTALKNADLTLLTNILAEECPIDDIARQQNASLPDDEKPSFPLPEDHWINQPIDDDKTLLHLALEMEDTRFSRRLIECGARANLYNDDLDLAPIHVVAESGRVDQLDVLLSNPLNRADVNVTVQPTGQTALHIAVENDRMGVLERLLQQPGVRVNTTDLRGAQTPLYLAAKQKNAEAVRSLLENGAGLNDICRGRTVKDTIKAALPYFDVAQIKVKERPRENTIQYLTEMLERRDLAFFKTVLFYLDPREVSTFSQSGFTVLQKACIDGQSEFVQVLLEAGVDPNCATPENSWRPVLLAGYRGHHNILEVMKFHSEQSNNAITGGKENNRWRAVNFGVWARDTQETLLHLVLKKPLKRSLLGMGTSAKEEAKYDGRYEACLKLLVEDTEDDEVFAAQIRRTINKKDRMGNTPLHYATQSWSQDVVRQLLRLGANIGVRNWRREIPLSRILPETLGDFLDNDCTISEKDPTNDDFEVTFKYNFLAPPVTEEQLEVWDEEKQEALEKEALPETDCLWYISQSKEHRHLIKHPVITSFMWLKWQRIRRFFNRNLRFYALFVVCLTWYIFERFGGHKLNTSQGTDATGGNDEPPQFCNDIKWETKSHGFWYVIFVLHCLVQLLMMTRDWMREANCCSSCGHCAKGFFGSWLEFIMVALMCIVLWGSSGILWTVLTVLIIMMFLREGFQMISSVKRYFFNVENCMEVALLGLSIIILYVPDASLDYEAASACGIKRHLAAVCILLSWAEFITLIGRHPRLSRYNVYVTMFYKVLETFFLFLIWYLFFVVAFGLGFYIMLHQDVPGHTAGDDDYIFFDSPWLALVKTSTMFVGEIEFSDVPIANKGPLSALGYLFLLSFVFLIVVVLMNLLNGLAVSDTGVIHQEAEIVSHVSRVETISYSESILLGDPFDFLANWAPFSWARKIPSCTLLHSLYSCCPVVKDLSHKMTGATGILLFYSYLTEKQATFPLAKDERSCFCLQTGDFQGAGSEEILSAAKKLILERRRAERESQTDGSQARILEAQETIMKMLATQQEEIKALRMAINRNSAYK